MRLTAPCPSRNGDQRHVIALRHADFVQKHEARPSEGPLGRSGFDGIGIGATLGLPGSQADKA